MRKILHCSSCGTLLSALGSVRAQICPECQEFVGKKQEVASGESFKGDSNMDALDPQSRIKAQKEEWQARRDKKRKRLRGQIIAFTLIWLILLGAGGGTAWLFLQKKLKGAQLFQAQLTEGGKEKIKERLIKRVKEQQALKELGDLNDVFLGFINAEGAVDRWPYVFDPSRQSGAINEYKEQEATWRFSLAKEGGFQELQYLQRAGHDVLGGLWKMPKKSVPVVFVRTLSGWTIDWQCFARYSRGDWKTFFASNSQQSEGEFRLYLELRTTPGTEGEEWEVFVYEPYLAINSYDKKAAAHLKIKKDSAQGRQLTQLVKDKNALGGRSVFQEFEKTNYYRVRALFRWEGKGEETDTDTTETETETETEKRLTLVKICAANWLDDQLQLEPSPQSP